MKSMSLIRPIFHSLKRLSLHNRVKPSYLPRMTYHQQRLSHYSIPDNKESMSIIPVLDTIDTKTTQSYNSLMNVLAKEGRSAQAQTIYDKVFRYHDVKADMDTYTHLMLAYINDNKYEDAMEIYYQLRDHQSENTNTHPMDTPLYEKLINALCRIKKEDIQHSTDEPIYEYTVIDNDTPILVDLEGNSNPSLLTAITLFNDMRQLDIQPTANMYLSLLDACTHQQDGFILDRIHKLIRVDMYLDIDTNITNHLMKAYQSIGDVHTVFQLWDSIRYQCDNTTLSIMMKVCLDYNYLDRADNIWNTVKSMNRKIEVHDFNNYLLCILRSHKNQLERADQLIKEALVTGEADESSVNIWEEYSKEYLL
ncbi:hypothetical protein BDB01DRAFT_795647 [Pilobolus umbonatus]|nr:hypothetical protein BDB01DRAFT_795647 [Pilobolus umbonatus]